MDQSTGLVLRIPLRISPVCTHLSYPRSHSRCCHQPAMRDHPLDREANLRCTRAHLQTVNHLLSSACPRTRPFHLLRLHQLLCPQYLQKPLRTNSLSLQGHQAETESTIIRPCAAVALMDLASTPNRLSSGVAQRTISHLGSTLLCRH